jgi:glycosyltransferase involved in cell wall biosynthesis
VTLVGAEPAAQVQALARRDPRVTVTGAVPDVRPYLRRATLSACPLVYAVGMQGKILEAMASATPVLATPGALAAIGVRSGEEALQADGNETFSHEILRLLGDAALRRRVGDAGRARAVAEHGWNSVVARLEELYQGALARFRARGQG